MPSRHVFLVRLSNPPMTLARLSHSSVRPATKPLACGSALREREPVDKRLHLIGKCRDTLGVAQPHLQERVEPDGDHPRYRLSQLRCARVRLLHACARLLDQAKVKQLHAEQPQEHGLRIGHEGSTGGGVERLQRREPALEPGASGERAALQHVHVALHGARAQQQDRIVSRGRKRLFRLRQAPRDTPHAGKARMRTRASAGPRRGCCGTSRSSA